MSPASHRFSSSCTWHECKPGRRGNPQMSPASLRFLLFCIWQARKIHRTRTYDYSCSRWQLPGWQPTWLDFVSWNIDHWRCEATWGWLQIISRINAGPVTGYLQRTLQHFSLLRLVSVICALVFLLYMPKVYYFYASRRSKVTNRIYSTLQQVPISPRILCCIRSIN